MSEKRRYTPPKATIWTAESLDGIEAEMAYGIAWPVHSEGSSSRPINLLMRPYYNYHYGTSRICWLKFTTSGSYDISCSASGAYIKTYNSFQNAPLDPIHISDGSLFDSFGCYGSVIRYICISSKTDDAIRHSCAVKQHLDTHTFDTNAGGAYWVPINDTYRENPDITPCRVIYLPGSAVDAIYRLIEDNPAYGNAQTFYDILDQVLDEVMGWAAKTAQVIPLVIAMALRTVCVLTRPESAQQVIDAIKSNLSLYTNGIRAEETINVYSPVCKCTSWKTSETMRGIAGSIGDWYYYTKDEVG